MRNYSYNVTDHLTLMIDMLVYDVNETDNVKLSAILDIGATRCLIPKQVLIDLGYDLSKSKKSEALTGGGITETFSIDVSNITAVGETVKNIQVSYFEPYPNMPDYFNHTSLLGMNFIYRFDGLNIDFLDETIKLTNNKADGMLQKLIKRILK